MYFYAVKHLKEFSLAWDRVFIIIEGKNKAGLSLKCLPIITLEAFHHCTNHDHLLGPILIPSTQLGPFIYLNRLTTVP